MPKYESSPAWSLCFPEITVWSTIILTSDIILKDSSFLAHDKLRYFGTSVKSLDVSDSFILPSLSRLIWLSPKADTSAGEWRIFRVYGRLEFLKLIIHSIHSHINAPEMPILFGHNVSNFETDNILAIQLYPSIKDATMASLLLYLPSQVCADFLGSLEKSLRILAQIAEFKRTYHLPLENMPVSYSAVNNCLPNLQKEESETTEAIRVIDENWKAARKRFYDEFSAAEKSMLAKNRIFGFSLTKPALYENDEFDAEGISIESNTVMIRASLCVIEESSYPRVVSTIFELVVANKNFIHRKHIKYVLLISCGDEMQQNLSKNIVQVSFLTFLHINRDAVKSKHLQESIAWLLASCGFQEQDVSIFSVKKPKGKSGSFDYIFHQSFKLNFSVGSFNGLLYGLEKTEVERSVIKNTVIHSTKKTNENTVKSKIPIRMSQSSGHVENQNIVIGSSESPFKSSTVKSSSSLIPTKNNSMKINHLKGSEKSTVENNYVFALNSIQKSFANFQNTASKKVYINVMSSDSSNYPIFYRHRRSFYARRQYLEPIISTIFSRLALFKDGGILSFSNSSSHNFSNVNVGKKFSALNFTYSRDISKSNFVSYAASLLGILMATYSDHEVSLELKLSSAARISARIQTYCHPDACSNIPFLLDATLLDAFFSECKF